jgi:hypothetical protein
MNTSDCLCVRYMYRFTGEVPMLNHVVASLVKLDDRVRMGLHFCLECLMLLDFRLEEDPSNSASMYLDRRKWIGRGRSMPFSFAGRRQLRSPYRVAPLRIPMAINAPHPQSRL